jgi:hypothetical protein
MFDDVIPLALIAATALLIMRQRNGSKDHEASETSGSLDLSARNTSDEQREDSLADKATVLTERLRMIGPNTALSYGAEPLMMLHGRGVWLYDEHDRHYLDCVNNVAHVGHCHPKVALVHFYSFHSRAQPRLFLAVVDQLSLNNLHIAAIYMAD